MTDMHVNRTGALKAGPLEIPAPSRPVLPGLLWRTATALVARWRRHRSAQRTRRALEHLDEAGLQDIGLSRGYYGYEPESTLTRRDRVRIQRLGAHFGLWRHGLD
jgi:uncharacterized protein YjiS (DUF1127 family)